MRSRFFILSVERVHEGAVRTLLDRFYGLVERGSLHGKLFFLYQGAAPEKWMLEAGE